MILPLVVLKKYWYFVVLDCVASYENSRPDDFIVTSGVSWALGLTDSITRLRHSTCNINGANYWKNHLVWRMAGLGIQ